MLLMGLAMAGLLSIYVCWLSLDLIPGDRAAVGDVFFAGIWIVAIASAWCASRRSRGSPQLSATWRGIAVAACASLLAALAPLPYVLAGLRPSYVIGDAISLLFYPLLIIGLRRLPRLPRSHADHRRLLLDVAVVAIGGSAVVVYAVLSLANMPRSPSPFETTILLAHLLGDMLLVVCVARLWLGRPPPSTRAALRLLGAALVLLAGGNLAYGYVTVDSGYHRGDSIDAVLMIGIALLAVAGAAQRSVSGPEDILASAGQRSVSRLPYCAVALGFALLIVAQRDSSIAALSLTVTVALLSGLVSARQFLAQHDLLSAQGQLTHQSLHDALTGLPNRVLVYDRAHNLLARARRDQTPAAALYLDLDNFKDVNDTFGHKAGDELIEVVASRLSSIAREGDTVGRVGGDEFVLLLEDITMDAGPELVAERVLALLRQPITIRSADERPYLVTASIGIAIGELGSPQELFRDADTALHEAKRNGRNCAVLFQSQMQTAVRDRLELGLDLKDALERDEFHLLYQPTIDLRTRALTGTEALIRWNHPTRGTIAPDRFIALAEETGMIVPIGRWVLETACRQGATWRGRGHDVVMYVNVSTRQLERDDLIDEVRRALETSGLEPAGLALEVTETGLMHDAGAVANRLRALKSLGIQIAIDDFGTGYSSLAYLAQFPADVLKIDRSFVSGIAASEASNAVLLHALIQLGKSLGLKTLGEGIETDAQLDRLQNEKCDFGQGYLFARPLEHEAVQHLLAGDEQMITRPPLASNDAAHVKA
jgi:diguanylate cyclase (GGDEF)-like protein